MKMILVIEDDRIMRENITELLELSGFGVIAAENGKIGVEKARQNIPDLIICDIRMPHLDGYGVLHILSREPEMAAIPFIFLTAKTEISDLRKGMNLGADDYLMKPFEDSELLNVVETRLRKSTISQGDDHNAWRDSAKDDGDKNVLILTRGLAARFKESRFKKKGIIYRPDDYPYYIFFIESGRVKTYLLNEDGKELISAIFEKGDIFGYQAVIENRIYREFAAAVDDAVIRKVPVKEFKQLFKENQKFAEGILRMISSDLTEKEEELLQMAYASVRKRLAIRLLEMTEESGEDSIEISRNNLASLLGTSTETLVRSLSELREMNLLSSEHNIIRILDRDQLAGLSRSW